MKRQIRILKGIFLLSCALLSAACVARAEVTRVEISSRQDVLDGKTFGTVGAYEKLNGKIYFALDPKNPRNRIIADLEKAPRNAQGRVEFSADLFILRPKDLAKANGVILLDIPNRGGKGLLSTFDRAKASLDPTTEDEFGDGLLMREGYTLVSVGWEFDVPKKKGLILLEPPVATDNGKPIIGWITPGPWFIPNQLVDSYNYASGEYFGPVYPPLDLNDPTYRLTERPALVSAPRLVPRKDWQFARMENGRAVPDPSWLALKGGFKPGMVYQVTYQSKNPPVAGVGFAAVRDFASAVKYDPNAIVRGKYVYTYGASQVGRWQRQMIYQGFTIDEQGRKAVDALFVHVAGTSLGSFNERWAQPDELGSYTQTKFPIRYEITTDPVTGKRDGLGVRIPAGLEPNIFLVDTESEAYDRGRVSLLRAISMDGHEDLPDPPNVRIFMLAGAKHGSGSWPPAESEAQQQRVDPLDYRWAMRALLIGLDRWVRKGIDPPASLHPRLADGTAIPHSEIKFPDVPGVQWPYHVPGGYRNDLPAGPLSVLPFLVPQVDKDGNVTSGIRLPEQSVPLGTYGGWAFRSQAHGQPDTLVSMAGSYIPFAKTRAEREKNHDPRLSLEERYSSRDDYLKRVQAVAEGLVKNRYLLPEDLKPLVEEAGKHWDWSLSTLSSHSIK
ncbi:MAG TPA: alpha/beta hydrolase domain-containing protein [Verrucomicrobiae bacterium]|nr:alpha/beta hydrolase domain-containing protein [Verrucomicrobiae bacterium]